MAKRPSLPRPVAVKEVLQDLLNPGDREALELRQRIRQVWEETVPAALQEQARLVDLRRKELWVEVRDHLWGQELQFLRTAILEELARSWGRGRSRTCASGWESFRGVGCVLRTVVALAYQSMLVRGTHPAKARNL